MSRNGATTTPVVAAAPSCGTTAAAPAGPPPPSPTARLPVLRRKFDSGLTSTKINCPRRRAMRKWLIAMPACVGAPRRFLLRQDERTADDTGRSTPRPIDSPPEVLTMPLDRIRRRAWSFARRPARVAPLLALVALLVPLARTRAEKAPEPSPYPITPELEFKAGMPKRIVVSVPGELYPKAYWYLTYTVTNTNDKPFQYLPTFELLDDA